MLQSWIVIAVALGYIGLLFVVASYGDRVHGVGRGRRLRLLIYPLSLAIYCTSWTFFGSVGLASRTGYDFLAIYVGPILMIGLATPFLIRVKRLAKAHNITSIADFIAARHGKDQRVAALVAIIAIFGSMPYIALQLKAVSSSLGTILSPLSTSAGAASFPGDLALVVAVAMAIFAMLFGTRHIDATEHQDGLVLAIALESIVKLVVFVAVGAFVTFVMFEGPGDLFSQAMARPDIAAVLSGEQRFETVMAMTMLSFLAIILLPRQFHVAIVENRDEGEIRRAAWLFPLYLILINLFVVPIAVAGLLRFPAGAVDSDMFVLALPLSAGSHLLAIAAFVGGLSAATAMVIVETVALAVMVSNDLVLPEALKRRPRMLTEGKNAGALLLVTRRCAISCILVLAYLYYRIAGDAQLASMGLLSFAALAQLAPAFFGGLFWRRATAGGALAGMAAGFALWVYTLLLPTFAEAGQIGRDILMLGPWGLSLLQPQALLGTDLPPLVHGTIWSLAVNALLYVTVSLLRKPSSIEQLQAEIFVPSGLAPAAQAFRWRSSVTVDELQKTVARYLGDERTRTDFAAFTADRRGALDPAAEADVGLLRHAEHLLASAIGAASSRLVLSLLLRRRSMSTRSALKLLDDASAAIHYNREILQTALDHVSQGLAVFDKNMELICWNHCFGEIAGLPHDMLRIGMSIDEIIRFNAMHAVGTGGVDDILGERLAQYLNASEPFFERFPDRGLVVEVRINRMPDGGSVVTLTDITVSVRAADELERSNETLERRVRERTQELERLNTELGHAKAAAEDANVSKTRFLAAASHDILQPLNAARLYVTSLVERRTGGEDSRLAGNIDASLEAVEDILGALLDISRLDTGVMKPDLGAFRIDDMLRQIELEFAPLAREKDLSLTFLPCSVTIRSDRRLLRRLLQNLVSNAIKYTPQGRVLVGCRRKGPALRIDVYDTGIGIPKSKQRVIFAEFHRLDQGAKVARGLGLGLSIVERIARVLDHKLCLVSAAGRGSHFSLEVPAAPAVPRGATPREARARTGDLAGTTVLCIDNEPKILDGMVALLGGWGCRVITAQDIPQALAAARLETTPLHNLLVDYHLDGVTGLDAIAALRGMLGADLPAILITADRSSAVREAADACGIHLLQKPIKPAALRAVLNQWRVRRVAAE